MTVLYNREYVDSLKGRIQRNCILLAVVAGVCILEGILSCLLIQSDDEVLLINITKATLILGGWICIYYSFAHIFPDKRKYNHLCMLLRQEFWELQGSVVRIDKKYTLQKDISAQKIVLSSGEEETIAYWDTDFGEVPFSKGQYVTLCVSNRFVISYITEEMEDDS